MNFIEELKTAPEWVITAFKELKKLEFFLEMLPFCIATKEVKDYIYERIKCNLEKIKGTQYTSLHNGFRALLLYAPFTNIGDNGYIETEAHNSQKLLHISIIVPVFNQEKYLERCFNSIINQTYPHDKIECIFINDCSTDKSVEIIQNLIARYTGQINFKIIHHEKNKGLGETRNTGIRNIENGQYLFFFDCDDEITPNALQILSDLAQKYDGVDMVCGTTLVLRKAGNTMYQYPFLRGTLRYSFPEYTNDRHWIRRRYPLIETSHTQEEIGVISMTACDKLIRKEFILENNLWFSEIRNGEDVLWSFYASKFVKDIAFAFQPTYFYHNEHDGRICNDKESFKSANARLTSCETIIRNYDVEYLNEAVALIHTELKSWVIPYLAKNDDKEIEKRVENINVCLKQLGYRFVDYKYENILCLKTKVFDNSDLPTYLYGAQVFAEVCLKSLLIPNDVAITGVFVSKKHFKENTVICGHSVKVLEDVLNKNLKANIVLGFLKDNYDDVIEELRTIAPNCNFIVMQKVLLEELKNQINELKEAV